MKKIQREPVRLPILAAMDFGTLSTTDGVWLDQQYFEKTGLRDGASSSSMTSSAGSAITKSRRR
ncbi:hypothetical protein D3Z50_17975 [Clostridiaceae bacterium]|nr:hypothetical protein [Clostridiaceae bacterium]